MPDIFDELNAWSSGGTATKVPPAPSIGGGDIFSELSSWASQPASTPKSKDGPLWEPIAPQFTEPDDAPDLVSRPQFSSEVTEPGVIQRAAGEFVKAIPRGAMSTVGLGIQGAGLGIDEIANLMGRDPDMKEIMLTSLGKGIQNKAQEWLPPSGDPRYSAVQAIGEGLGSGVAMLPTGLAGVAGVATGGFVTGYAATYSQVKEAGGTDEDARAFARLSGLVSGITEPMGATLPTLRILKRLDKATDGWVVRQALKSTTGNAFEEAVQEIPDEIARHAYDKERTLVDSLEAAGKSGMVGGLVGTVLSGAAAGVKAIVDRGDKAIIEDYQSRVEAGQTDPVPSIQVFKDAGYDQPGTRKERAEKVKELIASQPETGPQVDAANAALQAENDAQIAKGTASGLVHPAHKTLEASLFDSKPAGTVVVLRDGSRHAVNVLAGVDHENSILLNDGNLVDANIVDAVVEPDGHVRWSRKGNQQENQNADQVQSKAGQEAKAEAQGQVPAVLGEQRPTSIKNAVVDEERAKRGLRPAMEPASRSFGTVWDEAMETVERNPVRQEALVAELRETPRAVTDLEDALLLHRQVTLQNEYDKVADQLDTDLTKIPVEQIAALEFQEEALSQQLLELYDTNKAVGTETGRGLNARRMMALEDFTLAKMLAQKRKAKGDDFGTQDRVEVAAQQRKIADLEKRLAEHQTRIETLEAEKASNEAFRLQSQPPKRPRSGRKAAAQEELKAAWKEAAIAGAGVAWSNPVAAVPAFVRLAKAFVNAYGVVPIQEFYDAAKAQFGADKVEKAKQFLADAWNQAIADAKPTTNTKLENNDQIRRYASKLAEHYVATGIRERDAVIDAVHGDLQEVLPDLTRRETMDAISGYGHFQPLSKDEIKVALRDLKGQMQQVGKIEDMQAKMAPRKTGPERRTPSSEEKRLIKAVNELKKTGDFKSTEDTLQTALATFKKRTQNRIDDYQKRLSEGDFAKRARKPLKLDAEGEKLRFEAEQAKADFLRGLEKDRRAKRTTGQKIIEGGAEVLNTSRAILTSMDFSAVGRQGGFLSLSHPLLAKNAGKEMFKSFASEAAESRVMNEIANRPNSSFYRRAKLALTGIHGRLSQQEEAYMSQWAKNIPLVAGSERAYVTFLNLLRADVFDSMVASLGRSGSVTDAEAAVIANYVNVATGRGDLGKATQAATTLATVFFAPRYVWSRFQLLTGQPLRKAGNTWRTRKLIATEYARSLGGLGLFYGTMGVALTAMLGDPGKDKKWNIETDPRSSDFGKIRIGNSRIDPMMGLQQAAVLLARFSPWNGGIKTRTGEIQPIDGSTLFRFLETKVSPPLGFGINAYRLLREKLGGKKAKNVVGEQITGWSLAEQISVPLSFRDVWRAMKEQGIPGGTALSLLNMLGVAVQTYADKNNKESQNETRRRLGLPPIP